MDIFKKSKKEFRNEIYNYLVLDNAQNYDLGVAIANLIEDSLNKVNNKDYENILEGIFDTL